jgi:hypothetical protein
LSFIRKKKADARLAMIRIKPMATKIFMVRSGRFCSGDTRVSQHQTKACDKN